MTKKDNIYLSIILLLLIILGGVGGYFLVIKSDWFVQWQESRAEYRAVMHEDEIRANINVGIMIADAQNSGLVVGPTRMIDEDDYQVLIVEVDGELWNVMTQDEQRDFTIPIETNLFNYEEHTALRIVDAETGEVYIQGVGPMRMN